MRTPWIAALFAAAAFPSPGAASVLYNNLTPNNLMAMATRPDAGGVFEIESADDFALSAAAIVNSAAFTGLIVPSGAGTPTVGEVVVEIYRVFPLDSTVPPSSNVPTRVNSPSDVAFDSRDSAAAGLTFSTSTLASSFTASNSVAPGGIHAFPNQTTLGNGPVTGAEIQFNVNFATSFSLPAGHYFFVPQVQVTGGTFYWLSAARPVASLTPDLQAWTRDAALDPDWLRVGTDIVGGTTPPTFNAAFSLDGTVVPEPATLLPAAAILLLLARRMRAI